MSPLDPTHKDCVQLSQQYAAIRQSLFEQVTQCMKSEPVVGQGYGAGCGAAPTVVAWSQCSSIQRELCRLSEARDREVETCSRRSQARAERERRKAEADSKTEQRLADWSSRAGKAREIVSLVRDPKKYLATRLAGHAHVQRLLFRPDGTLDKGRAQQLYLGMHDIAMTGRVSANPLIGQIQREALRDIGIAHAGTMRSLDKLVSEMRTINADLQGTPLRPPAPRPPPVAQPQPRPPPRPRSCPPGWSFFGYSRLDDPPKMVCCRKTGATEECTVAFN
jgi:hypothetical protein